MSALLFDTLRLSRTLRDKGRFSDAGQDDLATKTDLARLEGKLEAKLAEAKADILKWVVGAIGFETLVILGALVSLARIFAK